MTKIIELFGRATTQTLAWSEIATRQKCPFLHDKKCFKIRKSEPETSIGVCAIQRGEKESPVIVCPSRFLQHQKIFLDCLHLLTNHEPGNDVHIVPEVKIPGGNVDFILASALKGKVVDFVGIELQSLDTTGSIWPERQRFLARHNEATARIDVPDKACGVNWKMTAKTILVQLNHKISTFEHVGKKLVLITQDCLFDYMAREFTLSHLKKSPPISCSMHFFVYEMSYSASETKWNLQLSERYGTDSDGVKRCLGIKANPNVELEQIIAVLENKISEKTLLKIGQF